MLTLACLLFPLPSLPFLSLPFSPPPQFNDVMNTNVLGPWLCSRAVLPHMRQQQWGRIINISSVLGVVGLPRRTPYCASKGALCQLTRSLALEVAESGITVNSVRFS